jgi:predicted outer membrane repeat protein
LSTTASLTMLNSTISGNTASAGAIGKLGKAGNAGSGAPRGSAGNAGFAGTAGTSTAGGIYSYGGALNLTQVTIAKNTAGQGGGIYLTADPTVAIDNCTIAFNKALIQGGGLYAIPDLANDPIHVISTIIGQNSAPTNADVAGYLTADNSLIQITGSATIVDNSSTDITGESPLLGALGNHGGTTQTLLPGKHSPAIGTGFSVAGVTPTMDQRGDPRTINGEVDIGSVEVG